MYNLEIHHSIVNDTDVNNDSDKSLCTEIDDEMIDVQPNGSEIEQSQKNIVTRAGRNVKAPKKLDL